MLHRPLATKLSSSSFVARIFGHALEDSYSKSGLVHSCLCISLLDPKRSFPSTLFHYFHGQNVYEAPMQVNQETVGAMLPKLGDLLILLNVSWDEKVSPTTYGQLKPTLGKHRLKVSKPTILSLRLGDDQGSLFTDSNWFAFQNDDISEDDAHANTTSASANSNDYGNGNGNSSSDDEVGVGEDELVATSCSNPNPLIEDNETKTQDYENAPMSPPTANGTLSSRKSSDGSESSQKSNCVASLFEEDVEFNGVEVKWTEKTMDRALKEGIVGETGR